MTTAQTISLHVTVMPLDDFDTPPSPRDSELLMQEAAEELYLVMKKYHEHGLVTVGFCFQEEVK